MVSSVIKWVRRCDRGESFLIHPEPRHPRALAEHTRELGRRDRGLVATGQAGSKKRWTKDWRRKNRDLAVLRSVQSLPLVLHTIAIPPNDAKRQHGGVNIHGEDWLIIADEALCRVGDVNPGRRSHPPCDAAVIGDGHRDNPPPRSAVIANRSDEGPILCRLPGYRVRDDAIFVVLNRSFDDAGHCCSHRSYCSERNTSDRPQPPQWDVAGLRGLAAQDPHRRLYKCPGANACGLPNATLDRRLQPARQSFRNNGLTDFLAYIRAVVD